MTDAKLNDPAQGMSGALRAAAAQIPAEGLTLRQLLELIGEQGMLMFSIVLTIPFLLPVSIPGVSTVFGLLILLIGLGVTLNRLPWLPARLMNRHFTSEQLLPAFKRGEEIFTRIDRIVRPRWLVLTHGATINRLNGLALIFSGLLLMAPFGLIPFSNTLPGIACLLLAAGMLQRDGLLIVLGYLFMIATVFYFGGLVIAAIAAGAGIRSLMGSG
jgi:hypothetical protein